MSRWKPCPFHRVSIKPTVEINTITFVKEEKTYWTAMVECPCCRTRMVESADTEREAINRVRRRWNNRFVRTTRRIIKGDGMTHYAWCEAGEHTMNPTGEYCAHCGRRVIDDAD